MSHFFSRTYFLVACKKYIFHPSLLFRNAALPRKFKVCFYGVAEYEVCVLIIGHVPHLTINGNFYVIEYEFYGEGRIAFYVHIDAIVVPGMTSFVKKEVLGNGVRHFLMVVMFNAIEVTDKNLFKFFRIIC